MIGCLHRPQGLTVAPIALAAILFLASQAAGADRPSTSRPRSTGPKIIGISADRTSLPARGGTVKVTMHTVDAVACRLVSVGRKSIGELLPRVWDRCSDGIATAVIKVGANPFGTAVKVHFRDFARRGPQVSWTPFTILVAAGPPREPAPSGVNGYPESTNWSGYVVPSSQALLRSASGAWTVPTLNCADTPNADVSEWVGIGGVDWPGGGGSGALLQTGTEDSCVDGVQQDEAWWELYPSNPNESFVFSGLTVSAGDEIVASVRETTGGRWTTKVDDTTQGIAGVMVTGAGYGISPDGGATGGFEREGSTALFSYYGGYSAEWIVEDARLTLVELAPFANFGAVVFSDLSTSLADWSLTPSEGVELVQDGVALSTPGPPSIDGFEVRYTGS